MLDYVVSLKWNYCQNYGTQEQKIDDQNNLFWSIPISLHKLMSSSRRTIMSILYQSKESLHPVGCELGA